MILLIIGGITLFLVIYGIFSAGTPRNTTTESSSTVSHEDTRRSKSSQEMNDTDLLSKLNYLSIQGFQLCFDDEVLLNNPELLVQLNENVRIAISHDVIKTLENHSRSANYAFSVKRIFSILSNRKQKKICSIEDFYLNNEDFSADKLSDRVIGAYIGDQRSNLHYNILVSRRSDWCRLAEQNGLNSLLVE